MNRPRILVVEDESIVAIDLSHTLTSLDYKVVATVGTGLDALRVVEKELPDLVLMDIQLRGELDGIDVAEQVRNAYHIPVIFLSAYSDAKTLARAKLTEPYGYIMKSYDHNDLHSTIEMALYRHEIERKVIKSEKLLSTTFAGISDGIFLCDTEGKVQLANLAAQKIAGLVSDEIKGSFINNLPLMVENVFNELLDNPFSISGFSSLKTKVSGRYFLETRTGRFPVLCTVTPMIEENDNLTGYLFFLRNIDEEYRMQEMQSRLASIVETSEDAIIGSTPEGTILSWNNGASTLFGYDIKEVSGKNLSILVPEFYPNEIPEMLDRICNGENVDHYETLRKRKDGGVLDMSVKISPIRDGHGNLIAVSLIARDITKRKQLEKEILEIVDRERSRIGQDLHDSLGQELTGILLRLKAHEGKLIRQNNVELTDDTREIEVIVRHAVEQTREMARGLIPVTLQTSGLVDALHELTLYCQSMYGVPTQFHGPVSNVPLSTSIELQLYHIAQEALNNAIKHSESEVIDVTMVYETTEVILSVIDRGRGLEKSGSKGLGLRIMEYRANMVGGHLTLVPTSGGGTTVLCRVPNSGKN